MKIRDVNGELHQLVSGSVKFDSGNDVATAISKELVKDLGLEPNPHKKRIVTLAGGLKKPFGVIEISIVVRGREFCVKALVGAVCPDTELLVGMDVIQRLAEEKFTLGTP